MRIAICAKSMPPCPSRSGVLTNELKAATKEIEKLQNELADSDTSFVSSCQDAESSYLSQGSSSSLEAKGSHMSAEDDRQEQEIKNTQKSVHDSCDDVESSHHSQQNSQEPSTSEMSVEDNKKYD